MKNERPSTSQLLLGLPGMPEEKRRRGGQPGNRNALKHGFYSRLFRRGDDADLEALHVEDLLDEIAVLRMFMRRALKEFERRELEEDEAPSLEQLVSLLRTLGLTANRLGNLLKAQKSLQGEGSAGYRAIDQALTEIAKEMENARLKRESDRLPALGANPGGAGVGPDALLRGGQTAHGDAQGDAAEILPALPADR